MKYFLFIVMMLIAGPLLSAQTVPTDASPKCQVPSATFNNWFQSGTPSADGPVNPANSVGFTQSSVCDFYFWAKQMFLWVTSESGGSHVFDSSVFYDVSPPNASGQRTFIPHGKTPAHLMAARFAKGGPHGLPIIEDKSGGLFEVVMPSIDDSGQQVVVDTSGTLVEVSKASITANHRLALQDSSGQKIELPSASAPRRATLSANAIQTAREFIVNGAPVFVDASGNIIDVEQGQAGNPSGVLESQTNGLVYYLTMTNDVYAYFLTGLKNGAIPATQFPTTAAELTAIQNYAKANGKPSFPDAQALTIELKTSWIEVNDQIKGNYITTTATIPTYDKSDPKNWVPNGQRPATLGLLGLHIVGSIAGHPEMVWATFEHFGDTPNAQYYYTNTHQKSILVPQSTAGTWEFSATNSAGPFNVAHMQVSGTNIIGANNFPISPSDSLRISPWGASPNNVSANTYLISVQNSVSTLMPQNDIRSSYFLVGATWTTNGTAPPGGQTGATNVANSTLETYTQKPSGCFLCHTSLAPYKLSHIFGANGAGLQPLFPASGSSLK